MNSDFRISVGFSRHHKTRKLKRLLGADGVLSLIWLWEYTAAERPDGNLSKLDDDDIELAADWNGQAGAFVKAIKDVGFLDDGNILHDWQEHNSWASNADVRSDKARLSKLAQVNAIEYQRLVDEGIKGISKEQYETLAKAGEKLRNAGDSLATAGETLATGKQTDCAALAPAPSPALTHNNTLCAEQAAAQQSAPFVFELPLNSGSHGVTQADIDHWQELYPAVDVNNELRRMLGWLEAHPRQRKTKQGIARFVNGWLDGEQNKPHRLPSTSSPSTSPRYNQPLN